MSEQTKCVTLHHGHEALPPGGGGPAERAATGRRAAAVPRGGEVGKGKEEFLTRKPLGVNLSDWGEEEEIEKCSVIPTVWVIPTGMTRYG